MFDENQLVEMKWANKTRKYYESKGYEFTNYGDVFFVKAKDLPVGSHANISVVCDICGKTYRPVVKNYNHRKNKDIDVCNHCHGTKRFADNREKRAKDKFAVIRNICKENGYVLLTDESEYVDMQTKISFECPKHGVQTTSVSSFIRCKRCRMCAYEQVAMDKMHTPEYVKSVIEGYNGNKWMNPEEYIGTTVRNLVIKCGLCGGLYTTSFNSYSTDATAQRKCFSCSCRESAGEERIRLFLEFNDIKFVQEYKFCNCCDKKPLPFDFYLPDYNLCIEFDGQHHFEDRGFGNFELTKQHDKIKNEYCESHDIDLLRIPYWEGSKIEIILKDKLCL